MPNSGRSKSLKPVSISAPAVYAPMGSMSPVSSHSEESTDSWHDENAIPTIESSSQKRNRISISKLAEISNRTGVAPSATALIASAALEAHGN